MSSTDTESSTTNNEMQTRVKFLANIITAIFEGLGLDDFFNGEELCFDQLELMVWYLAYSYDHLFIDKLIYIGIVDALRGVATLSPILRKCYNFSADNEAQWLKLAERLFKFENLWKALRENLIESRIEIDYLAWGSVLRQQMNETVLLMGGISRIVFLIFIQGLGSLTSATETPESATETSSPIVQASEYTPTQQRFAKIVREMATHNLDTSDVMSEYLEKRAMERNFDLESIYNKWDPSNEDHLSVGYTFEYPKWPYAYTVNVLHLGFEYIYEFFRGTRLASDNQLSLCEIPVTSYIESTQAATDYLELGRASQNGDVLTEGIFRVVDTLQWWLPIFQSCELTSRYIGLSFLLIQNHILSPEKLLLNLLENSLFLVSDALVLMADIFYKDYFSLSFWIGDIFFQVLVDEPKLID